MASFNLLLIHHSQYGQLKTSLEMDTTSMRQMFKRVSEERILGGSFATEFTKLNQNGQGGVQGKLADLYDVASKTELGVGEKKVRDRLGLRTI